MAAFTTIDKPSLYNNAKTYTGTGYSLALTGVGFQPDWTWIKCRSAGSATDHVLFDVLRGVQVAINSNDTSDNDTISNALTAWGADGFTVNGNGATGANGDTYVGWNWKAGGAGSANSDGATATTVSVNDTAGFSIVKWTGTSGNTTIGHGMNAAPVFTIVKKVSGGSGNNWIVYHQSVTTSHALKLNLTSAEDSGNNYWQSTAPTNSLITLTGSTASNSNGNDMIAYCFSEKRGYSKFGSYEGNGENDGAFIYTGFKPAWLMIKRVDNTGAWLMYDNKRNPFNLTNKKLFANETGLENASNDPSGVDASTNNLDMLSNGFKWRTNDGYNNAASAEYIYMAFAENPLVNTTGKVPTTAR